MKLSTAVLRNYPEMQKKQERLQARCLRRTCYHEYMGERDGVDHGDVCMQAGPV